jgi:regulator of RNase E activity RraA
MRVPSIPADILQAYQEAASSLLTDGMLRLGIGAWMDDVLPINASPVRVCGRARTLKFARKNGMKYSSETIYSFAESFEPGDIMVISAESTLGWLFGDNVATFCINNGVGGIVTDGRVRDYEPLRQLPLPVFCKGRTTRSFKPDVEVVAVDIPMEVGGAFVRPGDLVIGDYDGIAIAPNSVLGPLIDEMRDVRRLELEQAQAIRERKSRQEVRAIGDRKGRQIGPELDRVVKD